MAASAACSAPGTPYSSSNSPRSAALMPRCPVSIRLTLDRSHFRILADAARILKCDRSKVSRIETGHRGISAADLGELLDEYGVPGAEQAALAAIAHHGRDDGWWQRYRDV